MNKEEFLKMIREENEEKEPYENEISAFSWKIGAIVALGLSFVIYYLEWLFWGNHNYGLFMSIVSVLAVKFAIKAVKIKTVSSIVYAIIFSAFFVIITIVYIIAFINGWL